MTSKNTHSAPDTHKHPSPASRESSCSHSLQPRRRADYSPNYTPSPNYPIIKTLAVSHHINWVPPLCQFVWSQSATGVFFLFFLVFFPPVWSHILDWTVEAVWVLQLLKQINDFQTRLFGSCRNVLTHFFFKSEILLSDSKSRDFSAHIPYNSTFPIFNILFISYCASLSYFNWKSFFKRQEKFLHPQKHHQLLSSTTLDTKMFWLNNN